MVGLVLVSHSHALAEAVLTLVRAMTGPEVPIAVAAGTGDNHSELGTDAMEIYSAIESVSGDDGVLVLMDMGSAVLSAEMALDFLDESVREKVKLCPSSFVEGAVAAGVASKIGSTLQEVFHEASVSLTQKEQHISPEQQTTPQQEVKNLEHAETIQVSIPNPHGLHARPVANLIQKASGYDSEIQIRNLSNGKGPVSVRSMTGIVALEALKGNTIELIAQGPDAQKALNELKHEIEGGLGDDLNEKNTVSSASPQYTEKNNSKNPELKPIGVSKGIVIGKVFYPSSESLQIPEDTVTDVENEIQKLKSVLKKTSDLLKQKALEVSRKSGKEQGEIFNAQAIMIEDPILTDTSTQLISAQKLNAALAWQKSVNQAILKYRNLKDENLQQRALDLQDVSLTVLKQLGISINEQLEIPEEGIMIIEDITPGQVTTLDINKVKGVICLENGPTSHSSILLRSRGIPAIVQAKRHPDSLHGLSSTTPVIMNGETGEIILHPSEELLESTRKKIEAENEKNKKEKQESSKPAITTDGKTIEVFANVGRKEDAEVAAENGAEGIGLFRTEFMFIERETAPTEDEQVEAMHSILTPMKGKPVIIRTLDAGGDKEIPYLNMPKEENPFLGVRAIRLCLRNTELFRQQLRAILRISPDFDIQIMFPMISTIEELKQAKHELEKAHLSLSQEGIQHTWPISTGMMMEVPSAAIIAHTLVKEVDFISIGTNDLIQYTLAADRGNPELQDTIGKGLNPAIISLIKHITESANQQGVPVGVCGESASKPEQASILIGLGVTELSMNGRSIPSIKNWIRHQSFSELKNKSNQLL